MSSNFFRQKSRAGANLAISNFISWKATVVDLKLLQLIAGVTQLVEYLSSKQDVEGSYPFTRSTLFSAPIYSGSENDYLFL
jgi:hypothetical protein